MYGPEAPDPDFVHEYHFYGFFIAKGETKETQEGPPHSSPSAFVKKPSPNLWSEESRRVSFRTSRPVAWRSLSLLLVLSRVAFARLNPETGVLLGFQIWLIDRLID